MARAAKRFTIYDMMEEKGAFEINPANQDSRDPETNASLYKGPVQYPKMLYSPDGDKRIVVPAEIIVTPMGPKAVNEQRELVHVIVADEAEEKKYLALGWHNHPAKSLAAGGKAAPAMSSDSVISDQQAKIAELQLQLDAMNAAKLADQRASGNIVKSKGV